MPKNNQLWMLGTPNPVQTELDFLRSRLAEARRSGDKALEAIVIDNLHNFELVKATR